MGAVYGDYLIVGGEKWRIIEKGGIRWEGEKIVEVGEGVEGEYLGEGSVLLPSLVNGHTHLEFSGNRGKLRYGKGFVRWLESVIAHREEILNRCREECYRQEVEKLIDSGVTAIGEISSTGIDIGYLGQAPIEVVLYNEILGLNPGAVDFLYSDFLARVEESQKVAEKNSNFKVGISIHSPYSVHWKLVEKGLEIVKREGYPVQTHLLESRAEREWLEKEEGEFKGFFGEKFPFARRQFSPIQFIQLFEGVKVGFVHLTHGTGEEMEAIGKIGGGVIHCPISNRLLEGTTLRWDLGRNYNLPIGIGTDGLSSNYTLNIWEEMRVALFIHQSTPPLQLAQELLTSAFYWNRKILGLEGGELKPGNPADFIAITLPEPQLEELEQLPLQILLHTTSATRVYFRGKKLK